MRCSAPWLELNISAPDDRVSACCYYAGATDTYAALSERNEPLATTWNQPHLTELRRAHDGRGDGPMVPGCADCALFKSILNQSQVYADLDALAAAPDLSPRQRANARLAAEDFAQGRHETTATPLRIYLNFGFRCNLTCAHCMQVARRRKDEDQITYETVRRWWNDLPAALDLTLIGGEPLAVPAAVRVLREFIADPAMAAVRLTLMTNGTLVHKHMRTLLDKERLSFAISIDSVGAGYETIRRGGDWTVLRDNLLTIRRTIGQSRPHWTLATNAHISRTGILHLAEYARFHVDNDIATYFHQLWRFRGVEENDYRENVLAYAHLLDDIADWRERFHEAEAIFAKAGRATNAEELATVRQTLETVEETSPRRLRHRQESPVASFAGAMLGQALIVHGPQPPSLEQTETGLSFACTDIFQGCHLDVPLDAEAASADFVIRAQWRRSTDNSAQSPCVLASGGHSYFHLLDWREINDIDGLTKEMVVRPRADAPQPPTFLRVMLAAAAVERRNRLPDRIEIFRRTAPRSSPSGA